MRTSRRNRAHALAHCYNAVPSIVARCRGKLSHVNGQAAMRVVRAPAATTNPLSNLDG